MLKCVCNMGRTALRYSTEFHEPRLRIENLINNEDDDDDNNNNNDNNNVNNNNILLHLRRSMYKHIPKTNLVSRVYYCASILWLQFLVLNIAI